MTADSLFIAVSTLPCPTPGLDSVLVIRMPSRHRECYGVIEVDPQARSAKPTWTHCGEPTEWLDGLKRVRS